MDQDAALAVLASEQPDKTIDELLAVLLASDGDLKKARAALKRQKRSSQVAGLAGWLQQPKKASQPVEVHVIKSSPPPAKRPKLDTGSPARRSVNDVLKRDTTEAAPANLPPITLETPEAVAKHLPCTLQLNVLPAELASDLFLEMMEESEHWSKNKWYMVDREVESPHLTSFYGDTTISEASSTHWYVGRRTAPPRTFTSLMLQVREIAEARVREALDGRKRHPLEHAEPWRANVSAANRYYGRASNVGFHSDQLTYLGPSPTIASISLGCQRVFRLRGGSPPRTYNIPLPHNSLLLMHGGCQERYKHSIPPASALDAFKAVTDAQKRSFGDRINLTFRYYRPDFANPPVCKCGVPCLLRSDLKHNAGQEETWRYFWQCQAGQQNEGKGCSHWVALDMRAEGKGPCIADVQ